VAQRLHQYQVGERVRLLRGNLNLQRQASECIIEKRMPSEGAQWNYQVRSELEKFSRIVPEIDLLPLLPAPEDIGLAGGLCR
jgi:hypothetical protein